MPPSTLQHRRTHNLLLISRLLNQRDAASPFTLVLDNLEQSGKPLLAEYVRRANAAKLQVVLISFETLKKPRNVDSFVEAWKAPSTQSWQKEVAEHLKTNPNRRKLLIIDSLNPFSSQSNQNVPALLSSFITPTTSLLAFYHTDIPHSSSTSNPYSPSPLILLKYLATTIFTTHSLHHVLARKAARERSIVEPSFGLEAGVEGVLQGLGANGPDGMVLEMEHRRKSGRGVGEWYYLPLLTTSTPSKEGVILLEDHPLYRTAPEAGKNADADAEAQASTFELGLTEKQRADREGVVLPYFDAQKGGGEGGRILYDMGSEDDFDEEEDEI